MKTTKMFKVDLKYVGGYLITIAAALGAAYFMYRGHIALSLLSIVCSFSSNYYVDIVMPRRSGRTVTVANDETIEVLAPQQSMAQGQIQGNAGSLPSKRSERTG